MVLLDYTNIIVDDFTQAKQKPFAHYVHFLTHMHTDHFNGLSDSWNLGPIYCSQITADLLTFRFPKLHSVVRTLALNQPHLIYLNQDESVEVTVTLLNANHCAGAVMFLFQGYFGTVLHTGDIRFDRSVFEQYYELYPYTLRNPSFEKCSKHIDVLYLDNTFCDPIFRFPKSAVALKDLTQFITKIGKRRLYVGLDSIGKEEILIELARQFETCIVVEGNRYKNILKMGHNPNTFTTDVTEGWIEVVPKRMLKKKLKEDPTAIGLVPTGWCNQSYYQQEWRTYVIVRFIQFVPYSLHSNFGELQQFVKSIHPSRIIPIVRSFTKKQQIEEQYASEYTDWKGAYEMTSVRQNGLETLKKYTSPPSTEYTEIIKNIQLQKKINEKLLCKQSQIEHSRQLLKDQTRESTTDKSRKHKKGAKLAPNLDRAAIEESRRMLYQAVANCQQKKRDAELMKNAINLEEETTIVEMEKEQQSDEIQIISKQQAESNRKRVKVDQNLFVSETGNITSSTVQPNQMKQKELFVPKNRQEVLDFYFLKPAITRSNIYNN